MNGSSVPAGAAPARPVIGITPEGMDTRGNLILPRDYTDAVVRAGGIPVVLPPWGSDAATVAVRVEALILAGGGDLDPARYGGETGHPAVYEVDAERDAFEIALARFAVERGLPLLGICRGMQVLNVACGGTLHEHLPDVVGHSVPHRGEPPAYVPHTVTLAAGSRLATVVGAPVVAPESWHHQAIDRPAPGWDVVAFAKDGVIEAIERPGPDFLLAVQWHPEVTAAHDPAQQRLFDALVAAARPGAQPLHPQQAADRQTEDRQTEDR